jgi:hypothetical protein
MSWVCNTSGTDGNAYKILVGYFEEERPIERLKRRWWDNIKRVLTK